MNKMKEIRIEKITLNMGLGEAGEKVKKATKLLSTISGSKPICTKSNKRIPTWGVRPGLELGVKVTLRKKKAVELLKRLFAAIENNLNPKSFDKEGNFSFGIPEYIDIPDVKYDVAIGIVGLEVAVTLERPGYRIKKRKFKRSKIGKKHIITKNEAIEYIKNQFNIEIGGEEK